MPGSERVDVVGNRAVIAERITITSATVGERGMTRSGHKGTSMNKAKAVICTV